jgi:hypothetical protein
MIELEQPEWTNALERNEVCSVLYTQHYQIHCFRQRLAEWGVAYSVCFFYSTNKISLCVRSLWTFPQITYTSYIVQQVAD